MSNALKTISRFSDRYILTIRKALLLAFVALLPTQLGRHFFLPFSYVSGIRIDYLAPTIYVTDIIVFVLILLNLDVYRRMLRNRTIQYILFVLAISLLFASSPEIAVYRYLKIVELLAVGSIFYYARDYVAIFLAALCGTSMQAYIAIIQFVTKHSLGGDFYFVGERPLYLSLPGIAKASYDSIELLRPYGTFSHPNSMAGFFLLLYAVYLFNPPRVSRIFYSIFTFFATILIFLSASKIAILTYLGITIYYLYTIRSKYQDCRLCYISRFMALLIPAFVFLAMHTDPHTTQKRIELVMDSITIIASSAFTGVGLGNYLYAQQNYTHNYPSFILQPVHNIFLLLIAEVGIPVAAIITVLLDQYITRNNAKKYIVVWSVILVTGFFDHYWLTLQQNWLLMGMVGGLIGSYSTSDDSAR